MNEAKAEREFAFRGGSPCLDFANTIAWASSGNPVDHLDSYRALFAWGRQAGLLASHETEILSERATARPEEARATLSRAIALRDAVRRALSASIAGVAPDEGVLSVLNRELARALSRLRLGHTGSSKYTLMWDRGNRSQELELDYPLWPVAQSMAVLLTSPELGRVKVCADEDCGWMFLDRSRNSSRRWCDSRDCGNRERVRRHVARKRAASM